MADSDNQQTTTDVVTRVVVRHGKASYPSLLDLPSEIRVMIFKYLFTTKSVYLIRNDYTTIGTFRKDGQCELSLLSVCKMIAREAQPLFQPPNLVTMFPMSHQLMGMGVKYTSAIKSITVSPLIFTRTIVSVWKTLASLKEIYVVDHQIYHKTPTVPNVSTSEYEEMITNHFSDPTVFYPRGIWDNIIWNPISNMLDFQFTQVLPRICEAGIDLHYATTYIPSIHATFCCPSNCQTLPVFVAMYDTSGTLVRHNVLRRMNVSDVSPAPTLSEIWTPY